MTYSTHTIHATILERIQEEYAVLLAAGTTQYSLEKLLSPDSFSLDEYCSFYNPNEHMESLIRDVREYCQKRDIWLDNALHHISMSPFLFPSGHYQRMLPIMKCTTIDFYLNDRMGRDVFRWLSPEQQYTACEITARIAAVDEHLNIPPDATPIEVANIETLKDMKLSSPPEWFNRFLHLFNYHVAVTHRDANITDPDHVLSLDEYNALRCHFAGMNHTVMWIEYNDGIFLDWDWLADEKMAEDIRKLHLIIAEFAVLSNDLFSFEKEVIDLGSHSNLVMVLAFNHPGWSLPELFEQAAVIVRDRIREFVSTLGKLRNLGKELTATTPEMSSSLLHHLDTLDRCFQACWLWQKFTRRYKREHSIWQETSLSATTQECQ
jgi:hypothetical protein